MRKTLISLIVPVIIVIFWALLTTYTGIIPSYLIPSPHDVFAAFEELLVNGSLVSDTLDTLTPVSVLASSE
ncbi:hypothetical protein [Methanobacterium sp. SMA-27]|uniref:hypothetical protein n=1 Tax=Methanobacterium sp. SMA-27 TaxID=1495336 RepID=UPI00064FC1FD|nr:hypothetical protein [Methanobacterium sp. SMA-27]